MKGGDNDGWWRREVVTKGSGDEGKWWWRGMVRKGGGDDGKWWGREVVTKGSGRREVVTMGSGDDGKRWGRKVVTMGSGEEGKWWVGEEAGARNLVFFRVKWLQPAMKGTSSVRRVRLGSFLSRIVPPMCFAASGCSCVRSSMRFLKLWLQIALEWLHECCMGYVLGRKPEHETLCFSV